MEPKENHEEENNSEKKNFEDRSSSESKESSDSSLEKKEQPSNTDKKLEEKEEKEIPSYRTSTEEKKIEEEVKETVPLSKYLDIKKKYKELLTQDPASESNSQSLADFAEESGLELSTVKKLASLVSKQAVEEAKKIADERVKPLVLEKLSRENLDAFERDFEKSIASKYPDLVNKKETFKKIAFSKEFLHLKTLEDIKDEFYPTVSQSEIKRESVEDGSVGGEKNSETIDFATLTSKPEEYEKVMKSPKLLAEYYKWQDSQDV